MKMRSSCVRIKHTESLAGVGEEVVGVTGFEPATSWSQTRRSTKLSYTPKFPQCLGAVAAATALPS